MIKCVIFDCDGLMFDSEKISIEVWKRIGKKYGFNFDEEFFTGITGSGKGQAKKQFDRYPGISDILPEIRAERDRSIFEKAHTTGIAKKGLTVLLDYLNKNNYLVCAGSSSTYSYVAELISTLDKPYHFDYICCGDMVTKCKPDPEIFLNCAKALNVEPENCLVLEDSKNGIIAAKNAGMISGFIYDTVSKDEQFSHLIDHEFQNLSQVIDYLKDQTNA